MLKSREKADSHEEGQTAQGLHSSPGPFNFVAELGK